MEEQGQRVAHTIMTVDRLVRQSDSDGEIAQSLDLPTQIRNERYRITVINSSRVSSSSACTRQCLVFKTGEISRTVNFKTEYPVESRTVIGGPLRVVRPDNGSIIRVQTNG